MQIAIAIRVGIVIIFIPYSLLPTPYSLLPVPFAICKSKTTSTS
ncbi:MULTISPECIES: hypothetical protein [Moorena]|nr:MULTISPECIES: hypothetical protein [Moorena]